MSIRILCKYKVFKDSSYFIERFNLIYKNIKNYYYLAFINKTDISSIINEFIICLFIVYDLDKNSKEKIKNIFQNYFLILMFIYPLLENKKNFDEFLKKKENKENLKQIFDLYNLKYKICFLLYNDKVENLKLNFEETIKTLENNEIIKNLITKNKNLITKNNNLILNNPKLKIPKFYLILLPKDYLEFCYKYMNINCVICNKKNSDFYVCLFCGSKICNSINCTKEIKLKGKKEYSVIVHSKSCGGGNILFISNKNSEIIYILKREVIPSGIYVYLNSFGEYIKDFNSVDNYVLNKVELDKSIQIFIDMTYR